MDQRSSLPPAPAAKPQAANRRRLFLAVVLGGLVILAVFEGHARWAYHSTVTHLQDLKRANTLTDISKAEADSLVRGFARRQERLRGDVRRVVYSWPSLISSYKVQLRLNAAERVESFDTDAEAIGENAPLDERDLAGTSAGPRLGQMGLRGADVQGVAVATHDVTSAESPQKPDPSLFRGALMRELIRQAFLTAARDGLQQTVRDESLWDEVFASSTPDTFPFLVRANIEADETVVVTVERDQKNGQRESKTFAFRVKQDRLYESILEECELLSRTGFVELLKASGVSGTPHAFDPAAAVPPEIEKVIGQIDEISQLAAIRALHSLHRKKGESPARVAALCRAYAHLGSLTENHWQLHPKVFKARALLLAQRLVREFPDSGTALAHRAYAWALAGRFDVALQDLQAVDQLPKKDSEPRPDWLPALRAYCEYRPLVLDETEGPSRNIATYFRLLLLDPTTDQQRTGLIATDILKEFPACLRALDQVCRIPSLGIRRATAEVAIDAIWPSLYERMLSVAGLPENCRVIAAAQSESLTPRDDEATQRILLIQHLKSSADREDLSLPVLGHLLHEVSFLHALHKVNAMGWLGIGPEALIEDLRPLLKGHPYAGWVESFATDVDTAKQGLQAVLDRLKSTDLDLNARSMISSSNHKHSFEALRQLNEQAVSHQDLLYADLMNDSRPPSFLMRVAPHRPQAVAYAIRNDWKSVADRAAEFEDRYRDSGLVLTALAERHLEEKRWADAQRTLEQQLASTPEHRGYMRLAELFERQRNTAKWLETLKTALALPVTGLEHTEIYVKLAEYHMRRKEWETAIPFADAAAQSYSAWGLLCGAQAHEGAGDYDTAEALVRATSERYDDSRYEWYFWCVRTGRGDLAPARQLARSFVADKEARFQAQKDAGTVRVSLPFEVVLFYLAEGDTAAAMPAIEIYAYDHDPFAKLHTALVADSLGNVERRDALLRYVVKEVNSHPNAISLAHRFLRYLESTPPQWNAVAFENQMPLLGEGGATSQYYYAGKFLCLRGETELGMRYLQLAASSPLTHKYACLLACLELRQRKIEPEPPRNHELDGPAGEIGPLLEELDHWIAEEDVPKTLDAATRALEAKPDLPSLLAIRGNAARKLGRFSDAVADYNRLLELDPEFDIGHLRLAMILASAPDESLRNGPQALEHAQAAARLRPPSRADEDWLLHETLAAAFAACGQFAEAVDHQKQALKHCPYKEREAGQAKLKLFEKGQAYYDGALAVSPAVR